MDTQVPTRPTNSSQEDVFYPESDGQPMGETGLHVRAILYLYEALHILLVHWRRRRDVYVAADMFMYYEKGNPRAQVSPDVMVIFGVDAEPERRTFRTWDEGAVPDVVFEITSLSTWKADLIRKSALYARLGVQEYFIFDPLREYLPSGFQGVRLEDGDYVDIAPNPDGSLTSERIGVHLLPDGPILRVIDAASGKNVPALEQAHVELEQMHEELEDAKEEIARLRALLGGREGKET